MEKKGKYRVMLPRDKRKMRETGSINFHTSGSVTAMNHGSKILRKSEVSGFNSQSFFQWRKEL